MKVDTKGLAEAIALAITEQSMHRASIYDDVSVQVEDFNWSIDCTVVANAVLNELDRQDEVDESLRGVQLADLLDGQLVAVPDLSAKGKNIPLVAVEVNSPLYKLMTAKRGKE